MTGADSELIKLEDKIGYRFTDRGLLQTALTHSSYAREKGAGGEYNERMEFLGDAMLDAIAGEELYREFPEKEEGFLSRTRASLVCEKFLFEVACRIGLGEYLMLGAGEEKTGGRTRPSILADAVEALIGAVFLDGGYEEAKRVVLGLLDEGFRDVREGRTLITDYKTALQELLQSQGASAADIQYVDAGQSGPDHDKVFTVGLYVGDSLKGTGTGHSKQEAQTAAAREGVKKYRAQQG